VLKKSWDKASNKKSSASVLVDKLKMLRYDLKHRKTNILKLKQLIEKCNKVIFLLDELEEARPLFLQEFNFRNIVKLHLDDLLLAECNYWRKRCTIRWIKMGEDNTKFFHSMATERFRRNCIKSLKASDGRIVDDHTEMAGMLWTCYKERMGRSEGIDMQLNLQ
jgi:hypothetical protein